LVGEGKGRIVLILGRRGEVPRKIVKHAIGGQEGRKSGGEGPSADGRPPMRGKTNVTDETDKKEARKLT